MNFKINPDFSIIPTKERIGQWGKQSIFINNFL